MRESTLDLSYESYESIDLHQWKSMKTPCVKQIENIRFWSSTKRKLPHVLQDVRKVGWRTITVLWAHSDALPMDANRLRVGKIIAQYLLEPLVAFGDNGCVRFVIGLEVRVLDVFRVKWSARVLNHRNAKVG